MLVLSRKPGDEIAIAGDIIVRVLEIGPGRVRLGVAAPRDVRILRGELSAREVVTVPVEVDALLKFSALPLETVASS
ncbi:carbon storage regulator [Adhaeretor mobilis]|uniref:Translational regulator CsrA n=1 Tax=Adhaeretor mobilis TaxID=1930276 RepID=A0A517MZB9_9BACT|nr:carbon storage regulator [Adhaeretor mobilis]QDT00230.1 carbon storage regulator [Adhaeretor mobilis]